MDEHDFLTDKETLQNARQYLSFGCECFWGVLCVRGGGEGAGCAEIKQ